MKKVTFITGNQGKADYLSKLIGLSIPHFKADVDEIQSLDLKEVVELKLEQAFKQVEGPVLIEDVSLEFTAMGRLPGTFIKWFLDEMSMEEIAALLDGKERTAVARCMFGYYDGETKHFFEGSMHGSIAEVPTGEGGYGWDKLFVPEGYEITRAQMNEEDDHKVYMQIKPIKKVKEFLSDL